MRGEDDPVRDRPKGEQGRPEKGQPVAGCKYRILFALENDQILVHQVKDRRDAYRD